MMSAIYLSIMAPEKERVGEKEREREGEREIDR